MAFAPTELSAFVRRVIDIYNSHQPDQFDGLLTQDCVLTRNGVESNGREEIKRVLAKLYRAFPDIEYRIEDAIGAGDKLGLRWQGHGTHRGEYLGFAPTGREVSYDGITIYELRGDKVARIWVSADMLGLLRTLSAVIGAQPETHA
jgi:steroid delta-isomerase-like uncharacterized protein